MIKGDIGYFGLSEWWLNSFSESERKYIVSTYNPLSIGTESLTEGHYDYTSRSIISFLVGLSGWFNKIEDIQIALKIFEKIDSLIQPNTNIIDLHFYYSQKIEIFYKHRETYPSALNLAIESCKKQIEISEKASIELKKEYQGSYLPKHKGYEQLAIIEEKNKKYDNVIALCNKAITQKWNGDWQKRIERCYKKIQKM
ncbi:hypothetical protein EMA8858_04107 [Emticicia aquatica]|uniref:Uncharacterized protein n=1 Tax=Emticicia aquatica TaxID=1681835 RepID=A0ABM9AVA2_9BACT|nr:hypothetical protein [Emticicia aquatica]CAH0997972.1 hypothetical protein EMA8858_04107 [Emticicia aquatica]